MITFCVDWMFFVAAKTDKKCEKLNERIHESLQLPLQHVKSERYWKDKSLYRIIAKSRIDVPSSADGFYTIMKAVNGLAGRWTVSSPVEDVACEFNGDASDDGAIRIPGIKFISFSAIGNEVQPDDATAHQA